MYNLKQVDIFVSRINMITKNTLWKKLTKKIKKVD